MAVLPELEIQRRSEDPAQDERWMLAKRVARSATFTRSDRLSKLLLYVCRMHIAGRDEEINEQRIGIDIFRRSPSFDSGSDSIVRSHATRLRQRLELYFTTEGRAEALRVEIPRGGYTPRFFAVQLEVLIDASPFPSLAEDLNSPSRSLPEVASVETSAGASPPRRGNIGKWAIAFLAGMIVAPVLIGLTLHFSRPAVLQVWKKSSEQSRVEKTFWNSLFADGNRTLVVTGDSGLVLYETFQRQEVTLPDYISGNYQASANSQEPTYSPWQKDLPTRRYTSVADLDLAIRLSRLPQWDDQRAEVVFARDLRAADASKSNLVLIGSRQANPWVSLVDQSMNFTLASDGDGRFYFLNRHPMKGEQPFYLPSQIGSGTSDSSVYALICYRPNSPGMGKILLLSGLWQSGTETAGKYVMGDRQFVEFLSRIAKGDGSIPGFELLVQVRSVAGNAFTSSIIASRVQ